jgi:tetratricopeptide (TPR) repeat protein
LISFPQEVTTKVTVYDDIFLTESGLIPLPENAVELEREFTIQSKHFQSPIILGADRNGNIYASDERNGAVYKFDSGGEFQLQIGRSGKGRVRLRAPCDLWAAGDYLIVYDKEKERLEFMDFQGVRIKSQKMADFTDMTIDEKGSFYVAHQVEDKDSPLVDVYYPDKRRSFFGKPLAFRHSMQVLNSRSLALNEKGDLYVAFTYFPVVRKYSAQGRLLAEYRIENSIMQAKENYNLKKVGEGIAHPTLRAGYRAVIVDMRTFENKIYLLSHVPRLEITEMDDDGNVTATYWMDSQEVYETNNFIIQKIDGEKTFYVSHASPPKYDIDVFGKKEIKEKGGLKEEIEDLTDKIAANPDYYPAYNNRGLARVKTKDLDGAVNDFTKAVELEPGNAKVFFNRGIAHARKGEFEKAIQDFQQAANLDAEMERKAREQISFCLSQLK